MICHVGKVWYSALLINVSGVVGKRARALRCIAHTATTNWVSYLVHIFHKFPYLAFVHGFFTQDEPTKQRVNGVGGAGGEGTMKLNAYA